MNEFKTKETHEIKQPESQGFKEIKPQSEISLSDARQYIDSMVSKETDSGDTAIEKIRCYNEHLAGKEHPITGVPFEKRIVEIDGVKKEVVAAVFESKFDAQLGETELKMSDKEQFKIAIQQLREAIQKDEELKNSFDSIQLEQINDGETPDGYTWHHDTEVGKLQLVDTSIHQKTAHGPGGRTLWGGGKDAR
jgi:hypothetical protein